MQKLMQIVKTTTTHAMPNVQNPPPSPHSLRSDLTPTHLTLKQYSVKFRIFTPPLFQLIALLNFLLNFQLTFNRQKT